MRRRRTWLVHDAGYRTAWTGVPIDPLRADRVLAYLLERGWVRERDVSRPTPASLDRIGAVHGAGYLDSLDRPETVEAIFGFTVGVDQRQALIDHQRLVTGGTIQATRLALRSGRIAVQLAGGLHHAAPDRGMALCLFNDLAIAVRRLRAKGYRRPILIVDLDLHDGNGTRIAFAEDPTVFTFSVHNQTWDESPARADLCLALGSGVTDELYLETLRSVLPPIVRSHRPGLVLYVAGSDPSGEDRIGNWNVSTEGMLARDRFVLETLQEQRPRPRVAVVLGGGYGDRAWEHTARMVAWWVTGREERPKTNLEAVVRLYHRLGAFPAESSGDGGAGWTLDETDLGLAPGPTEGSGLVLGALSKHALELSLERSGLFAQMRALGFEDLRFELESTPPMGHTLRLFSDDRGPRAELLMELRLRRDRASVSGAELLGVEWLLLQNPRGEFAAGRIPLPGQQHPGPGLLRETVAWLVLLCERLRLEGILFVPAHYYMALLGRSHLTFLRPQDEVRFEAIRRAVAGMGLAEASRAIDDGRLVRTDDGSAVTWPAPPMVLPVGPRFAERRARHPDGPPAAALRVVPPTGG